MLCSWVCLGIIPLLKPGPHGKDINYVHCRDTHQVERAPPILIRWVSEGRGKEKASLETHTFGPATSPAGVKSPSPSQQRCAGAGASCGCFHGITPFPRPTTGRSLERSHFGAGSRIQRKMAEKCALMAAGMQVSAGPRLKETEFFFQSGYKRHRLYVCPLK